MGVDVDEARRDDEVGSVDHALRALVDVAERDDAAVLDADVGMTARRGERQAARAAEAAGVPVYIVHLSARDALQMVREAFATLGTGELVRRAAVSCAAFGVRGVTNVTAVRLGLVSGAEYASDLAVTSRQRAVSPTNSYVTVQRV